MADPVDVRDKIAERLQTLFAAEQPSVPMFFVNNKMNPPDNGIFVVSEIVPGDNRRADLNSANPLVRHEGVVNCRVMVPQETGTRPGQLVVDSLYKVLIDRQWSLTGGGHVTLYNAEMNARGEMNGYYMFNVSSEYRAYLNLSR